jgi:hypothetical protein
MSAKDNHGGLDFLPSRQYGTKVRHLILWKWHPMERLVFCLYNQVLKANFFSV